MKKNKFIILGLLLLVVAFSISSYYLLQQYKTTKETSKVSEKLFTQINNDSQKKVNITNDDITYIDEKDIPTLDIDGYDYCGILNIPVLDIELPVQLSLSDVGMKIAPGRYNGWITSRDLVIGAHNYRKHFGTLAQLSINDPITFTTIDNVVYHYTVSKIEQVLGSDVDSMVNGDWDMSLFTCTPSATSRLTIRCKLISID